MKCLFVKSCSMNNFIISYIMPNFQIHRDTKLKSYSNALQSLAFVTATYHVTNAPRCGRKFEGGYEIYIERNCNDSFNAKAQPQGHFHNQLVKFPPTESIVFFRTDAN